MFQTLQSRLPVELRLAGINTLSEANIFLNSYIKEYNAKFALESNLIKSVFEKQPTLEEINLILSVLTERKIDNGHCLSLKIRITKHLIRTDIRYTFTKEQKQWLSKPLMATNTVVLMRTSMLWMQFRRMKNYQKTLILP